MSKIAKDKYKDGHPPDKEPSLHYYTHGCRCVGCKQARRNYYYERKKRATNGEIKPEEHGTYGTYISFYCRCDACKEAARIYRANSKDNRTTQFQRALQHDKDE